MSRESAARTGMAAVLGTVVVIALVYWTAMEEGEAGATVEHGNGLGSSLRPLHGHDHPALPQALAHGMKPLEVDEAASESHGASSLAADISPTSGFHHVSRPDNERMFVASAFFEGRYAQASPGELEAARRSIEAESSRLMAEAADRFIDSGRAEARVVERPESGDFMPPAREKRHKNLVTVFRSEVLPGGELLVHTGELPWAEHIELYDSQDELIWLTREIGRRLREAPAEEFASEGR